MHNGNIQTEDNERATTRAQSVWLGKKGNTLELPVKDTKGMRVSLAIASPISAPPHMAVKMAPGKLFFSKTSATSLVIAIVISGVVGAPFLWSHMYNKRQRSSLILSLSND